MKKYLSRYRNLVKEWNFPKNGDLKPKDFTHGSHKKIWWICSKGHEWDAVIKSRTNGIGCPYCSGNRPSKDNNLKVKFPDIAKEFHPTKNGDLQPENFTRGSDQKVWWICSKGHEWDATIKNRTNGSGCPFCTGNRVSKENNLLVKFPDIAKEFHPTKNGDLQPGDFTFGSTQKVWWICSKGHEWDATISRRTGKAKTGCPFCASRKVSNENNLLVKFPDIAKEFHPTMNGVLKPEDFTFGSSQKVWWICSKGHEWDATINNRTKGSECPFCTNQSSKPEMRILTELMYLFDDVISRYKLSGIEIDVFVPNRNLGFEYDGSYFHRGREKKDIKKTELLNSKNINLIRIRETPLNKLSENDLIVKNYELNKKDIDKLFLIIKSFAGYEICKKIDKYIERKSFVNEKTFREYISYFPSPFPEKSLLNEYKELSKEWNYKKNIPLKPENFTSGSKQKVWWICEKGHEWDAIIKSRTNGIGCPYCSGKRVSKENNLLVKFPDIAKEFHPTKNGDLKPGDFTFGSNKKVWWICEKGHEWDATINSRTNGGTGCPYCYRNKK